MKKLRLILLAAIFLNSCASFVQFTEAEYLVQIFDDTPGTKDQLYLKANNWMIETFNNAESVIQHTDKEEGVIIGKYLMHGSSVAGIYGNVDTRVYAIIDIRVKDGKSRIEIKPQDQWYYDPSGMTVHNYTKEDAILDMRNLAENLHTALLKGNIEF